MYFNFKFEFIDDKWTKNLNNLMYLNSQLRNLIILSIIRIR